MCRKRVDASPALFMLYRQETMRYFGVLDEREWNAHAATDFRFGRENLLTVGLSCKDKSRNYAGTRFYYDLTALTPQIDDIYDTDGYLNFVNVANGQIVIDRQNQPKDRYDAGNRILAGYVSIDLHPTDALPINAGLRHEPPQQLVDSDNDPILR